MRGCGQAATAPTPADRPLGYNAQLLPLSPDLPQRAAAYVCFPFSYRGHAGLALPAAAALPAGGTASCAARGRPAATPTLAPAHRTYLGNPRRTHLHAAAATALLTSTSGHAQVAGVYADLAAHHHGRYRLQRHGDRVEATFMTTRSPVQAGTQLPPPVLFTLPPAFRPPFPVLRRGVGQAVRADGQPGIPPVRRRALSACSWSRNGRVRYLGPPRRGGAELPGL